MNYSFADRFYTIGDRLHRLMSIHSPRLPISRPEFFTMKAIVYLGKNHQKINTARLSDLLGVSKSAISQTINSMETKGYVRRILSTEDRRQPSVMLTESGLKMLESVKTDIYRKCALCFENFGEEKTTHFLQLLEELTAICEESQQETADK